MAGLTPMGASPSSSAEITPDGLWPSGAGGSTVVGDGEQSWPDDSLEVPEETTAAEDCRRGACQVRQGNENEGACRRAGYAFAAETGAPHLGGSRVPCG